MTASQPIENLPDAAPRPRLVLVDGSGYIFRAYHALPPLTRRDGTAVGAVYGFTNMLLKLRETYKHDMLAVIFDASRKTFRDAIYANYKANRSETPEDLIPQFPLVREATRALNIPAIELDNYEADDLIASYAEAARAEGRAVVIVSSDKDLMQLICEGEVTMFDPMKNKPIGTKEVFEKFGVDPCKVVEVQALIGDSVDNVPGVPSIGPKTAAELITQFGDLEGVLANLDHIKQPKRREVLTQHAENARLSRQLVELKRDVPLPMPLTALETKPFDLAVFSEFLLAQNFSTLAKKMGVEVPTASVSPTSAPNHFMTMPGQQPAAPLVSQAVQVADYEIVTDESTLARWVAEAIRVGHVAIDTETTSLSATDAELVGISLSTTPGKACYIPLGHVGEQVVAQTNLFGDVETLPPQAGGDGGGSGRSNSLGVADNSTAVSPTPTLPRLRGRELLPGQLPLPRVLELLQPLLTHPGVLKIGHNLKYDLTVLAKYGATLSPIADTMLMSYCIGGGLHAHGLDFLAERYFGHKMIAFSEVTGTGKNQKNFSEVALEAATRYAAEDADFTLRLYHALGPQLVSNKVTTVYETIERPLIPVIAKMEAAGIAIDAAALQGLSSQFQSYITALEKEIIDLAGMPFSVGSPKQLGEVLYDKLQLGGAKKSSKTGAYTTDAATLEALAEEGHVIARKVLDWRQYSKLKSTYTDALPKSASPRDGRVHTSFSMASTTTGRLSSSDPNLQNIPIRTEEGRRIRTAFIAPQGFQLISADYSQIELRLLAHMADLPSLKDAFKNGADIHAITASQMFGVPLDQMTGEIRRRAKAINFGIIYGISAHGLSQQLSIPRAEAASYIEKYFAQYPGIREYMDRTIQFAREHLYVETLFGRRVHVKDINAKNPNFRSFSERAVINAPLQGTAADIIKRAMVAVDALLSTKLSPRRREELEGGTGGAIFSPAESNAPPFPHLNPPPRAGEERSARLLLQVHDELIIEAPTETAPTIAADVKRAMEQVASLSVPLTVDVGIGRHWGDAH